MQPLNEADEGLGTLLPQSAVSVSWRGRPVDIPVQLPSSTTIGDLMALLYDKTVSMLLEGGRSWAPWPCYDPWHYPTLSNVVRHRGMSLLQGVRMENQKLVSRGKALSDTSVRLATIGLPVKLVLIGSTDEAVEAATTVRSCIVMYLLIWRCILTSILQSDYGAQVPKLDVRIKDDLTGGGGGLSRRAKGVPAQRKYGFGRIEVTTAKTPA